MVGMFLAFIAAAAAQPAERPQPARGAEATFRQAESLKSKEPLRARTLYESAARAGYAPAQSALGILLFKEGNRSAALRWLKMAADSGDPRALLIYGTAQFNGDGVPPNRIQGYAMVRRAAAQGLADAVATQSEMELVMPKSEKDAAVKLAAGAEPEKPAAAVETTAATPEPKAAGRGSKRRSSMKTAARSSRTARAASAPSAAPKAAPAAREDTARPAGGPWRIQLGAFRQPGAGQALFARLAPRLPGKQARFVPTGSLTRLLVGPYATFAEASAACRSLGPGQACMPIKG